MAELTYPVSIKGVLVRNGQVLLLRNERDEWELPGGRLEPSESPEECVVREIGEETGLPVVVAGIIDTWLYHIEVARKNVFIATYGCTTLSQDTPVLSHEHKQLGQFHEHEVPALPMPAGYKRSIATWFTHLRVAHGAG